MTKLLQDLKKLEPVFLQNLAWVWFNCLLIDSKVHSYIIIVKVIITWQNTVFFSDNHNA